jgi:hypothetical protein
LSALINVEKSRIRHVRQRTGTRQPTLELHAQFEGYTYLFRNLLSTSSRLHAVRMELDTTYRSGALDYTLDATCKRARQTVDGKNLSTTTTALVRTISSFAGAAYLPSYGLVAERVSMTHH